MNIVSNPWNFLLKLREFNEVFFQRMQGLSNLGSCFPNIKDFRVSFMNAVYAKSFLASPDIWSFSPDI